MMPDVDDQLSQAIDESASRDHGDPRATARRSLLGTSLPITVAVGLVLVVVASVTLLGWSPRHGSGPPSATTPSPARSSPFAILQPGQFVGLIPPPIGEKQYAWILTANGQPVRRLTHALSVVGLTGDMMQVLILQYPQALNLQSPDRDGRCVADPPYALVSLADGSVTAPFPGRSDVSGMAIGGQLVAGLSTPVTADKKGCQRPPQLLVRNLLTGTVGTYRLPRIVGRAPVVSAVSPDGRWVVLDNLDHPDHQVFYLAHLDAGTVGLTNMPTEPGCASTSFSAYPATNVLTVARACARTRTMTITSYDPDTLVATGTQTIADPPGAAVTFVSITWSRDGAQALVEAIQDNSTRPRNIYLLQSGRLTTITTTAYGLTW
jgi:hypothetical protein